MVEVLLVLEMFLTKDSQVEDLLCGAPSCSEACLLFSDDLFHLQLQSLQYDFQHEFAYVADEADRLVVLALLQVAFHGKCNDQGPRGLPFFCLPDLLADCRESNDYCFSTWLDQFCRDAIDSNDCTAGSILL